MSSEDVPSRREAGLMRNRALTTALALLILPADTAARVWLAAERWLGGLAERVDTRLASRLGGED